MSEPPVYRLPALPRIAVEVVGEETATAMAVGGFVDLRRLLLVARYPDGTESGPFQYDLATRRSLDAVVMAAYVGPKSSRRVYLRSALRPPCALRPMPPYHDGGIWELPAGLIDEGEVESEAAARELMEEIGISVRPEDLAPLGDWTFPTPGVIAERHVFFHVAVDGMPRSKPTEDGSALERCAHVALVPLADALDACRRGEIRDAKTELGLRRLLELP